VVGRGSFKTVYNGLDTFSGKKIAWCELHKVGFLPDQTDFEKEAEILRSLSHPNILTWFDIFYDDNSNLIMITELMTSGTLKKYVNAFKKSEVSKYMVKMWTKQILRGLNYLHTRDPPIIHRDLKCDNLFITGSTGVVKIGDYGLAVMMHQTYAKSVI